MGGVDESLMVSNINLSHIGPRYLIALTYYNTTTAHRVFLLLLYYLHFFYALISVSFLSPSRGAGSVSWTSLKVKLLFSFGNNYV